MESIGFRFIVTKDKGETAEAGFTSPKAAARFANDWNAGETGEIVEVLDQGRSLMHDTELVDAAEKLDEAVQILTDLRERG